MDPSASKGAAASKGAKRAKAAKGDSAAYAAKGATAAKGDSVAYAAVAAYADAAAVAATGDSVALEFAPNVRQARRRFFVPEFSYDAWRATIPYETVSSLIVDDALVDASRVVRVGSLDPGSVSFGWGIVEFAPLAAQSAYAAPAAQAAQAASCWLRLVRASPFKNLVPDAQPFETLPWAFRLVRWSFESISEQKKTLTKEQAVATATPLFVSMLRAMVAEGAAHVVIEQQLGMQNMMTTCLAHVFQSLCVALYPHLAVHFIAPQLTVPLFVSLLPRVPASFPMRADKVEDLKVKIEKKYASGVCAALCLVASGALAPSSPLAATWASVPRVPDPKYDDICDQMWNAVALWNKLHGKKQRAKRPRKA